MHDLKNLEPRHREAMDNVTELLQAFMERQEKLRQENKILSRDYSFDGNEIHAERTYNKIIINLIQLIRYFLMGYSPEEVGNKLKNTFIEYKYSMKISQWFWNASVKIYPYAKNIIRLDEYKINTLGYINCKDLIFHILDICIPKYGGIFSMAIDENYDSIALDYAVGLIKKEIE